MAKYTPEPREYELMVLLSPELGEEALEAELQRISDQITGTGAELLSTKSTTPWGRRRLAYPIQNHQDAFYVLYSISSQPGGLDPFERDLKLNGNVLRYLLIKQEKTELEPEETDEVEETESETEPVATEGDLNGVEPEAESAETGDSADEPAEADESATEEAAEETATASAEGSDDEQV